LVTLTRSTSFGPSAGTADTESTIGSAYTFPGSGVITGFRINGYGGVTDKAQNGILIFDFKVRKGPFEWAVCGVSNEITVGGARGSESKDNLNIPYSIGEVLTVKYKGAEASEEITVSVDLLEEVPE